MLIILFINHGLFTFLIHTYTKQTKTIIMYSSLSKVPALNSSRVNIYFDSSVIDAFNFQTACGLCQINFAQTIQFKWSPDYIVCVKEIGLDTLFDKQTVNIIYHWRHAETCVDKNG